MPVLEHAKHEEFCQQLAKGIKQTEAYKRAGYLPNAAAASRLVAEPHIQQRIDELREEKISRVKAVIVAEPTEVKQTLEEMGLTFHWVASQLQLVHTLALDADNFTASLTALGQITKLIEAEKKGEFGAPVEKEESKVKITEVISLMREMKSVLTPKIEEAEIDLTLAAKDITPEEINE